MHLKYCEISKKKLQEFANFGILVVTLEPSMIERFCFCAEFVDLQNLSIEPKFIVLSRMVF